MTLSSIAKMPPLIEQTLVKFLSAGDVDELSRVSGIFYKILNNTQIWTKIAVKLNLTPTDNPKKIITVYYAKENPVILRDLDPKGNLIDRFAHPLLQRRAIENYITDVGGELRNKIAVFVIQKRYTTAHSLLTHLPFIPCKTTTMLIISNRARSLLQCLIDRGQVFTGADVVEAVFQEKNADIALLLIQLVDVKNISDHELNMIITNASPAIIKALMIKGLTPEQTQLAIIIARVRKRADNLAILQTFVPDDDSLVAEMNDGASSSLNELD